MTQRTAFGAVVALALCSAPLCAQRALERTPNLPNAVTALPGVLEATLPHRFADFGGAEGLATSTTFDLALGLPFALPLRWTAGLRFAPSSEVVPDDNDEWEAYHRLGVLRQGDGRTIDVTLSGAYNFTAGSLDGEAVLARRLGALKVLGAARAMSAPYGGDGSRYALAAGAAWQVGRRTMPVTVSADIATLMDRTSGEDVAWSAAVYAGLPHTPFVFGLQVGNASTTTIEGASLGTGRTRYGVELNFPVETPGFILGWFTSRERAREAVTADVSSAAAASVRIIGYLFTPATVRIRAGETVEWINEDAVVHTVDAENGAFDSGAIRPGATWRARFDQAGIYPYYCGPHPFMKGVVVVTGG